MSGLSLSAAQDTSLDYHASEPLLIVNLFHPRRGAGNKTFWRAYRTDLIGFAAGWAAVLALIVLVWLIFRF